MSSKLVAVVDTNVILDVISVADLSDAYNHENKTENDRYFRRFRARDALIMAWYLHASEATTLSLINEVARVGLRTAPLTAGNTLEGQHMHLSFALQHKFVLNRWNMVFEDEDATLRGNGCDDELVKLAQKYGVPLVTNEGLTMDGVDDVRLRSKALAARVPVFTPRQFWSGRISETAAAKKFCERFDAKARKLVRRNGNSRASVNAVRVRKALLQHIFFGRTSDGTKVPVRPPWLSD